MAIVFEVTGKKEIIDMKEFCRLKEELTYVGEFANKETSEIIQGTIIQYDGKFYTNEDFLRSGVSWHSKDGMVTTSVELFKTDYIPEECKPVSDCPIRINIWDTAIDDEGPIGCYAFYDNQLEEAKEVVNNNKDVDIFVDGVQVNRTNFLER
ncbi:MAG: hypothetical protein HFJ35_05145 [Clostridia bacterium]|nr:hypothetical protein [Clostridia bacterium]